MIHLNNLQKCAFKSAFHERNRNKELENTNCKKWAFESAFPNKSKSDFSQTQYCRTVIIQTQKHHLFWRRKFCVLDNNFLLIGNHSKSKQLVGALHLEKASIELKEIALDDMLVFGYIKQYFQSNMKHTSLCPHEIMILVNKWYAFDTLVLTTIRTKTKGKKRHQKDVYYIRMEDNEFMQNRYVSFMEFVERASTLTINDIYRLRNEIGSKSSNKQVLSAKHRVTNIECAIKLIHKRKSGKISFTDMNIMKRLSHENVVDTIEIFETRTSLYVIMEQQYGPTLKEKLKIGILDNIAILRQIVNGVNYMHKHGIILKSLKPSNILFVNKISNEIRICYSRIDGMTVFDNECKADIPYIAPEILQKKAFNERVDWYSVGCIAYEMICGYTPNINQMGLIDFQDKVWDKGIPQMKVLIRSLLSNNANKRPNYKGIITSLDRTNYIFL